MVSLRTQLKHARPFARAKVTVLMLMGVGVIGATGWAVAKILSLQKGPLVVFEGEEEKNSQNPETREVASFTYSYDLSNISIPLANRTASQMAYAQFTLKLDCPTADAKRDMEINRAKILDKVFEVATQFYIEDFKNPQGYRRFKEALNQRLVAEFHAHGPRGIAIEEWVIE